MWNGVVTNAGLSLLEMWAAGGETLYIDRATAGTGTVAQDNMRSSTHVQGDVGAVPIVASIPVSSGTQYRIQVQPSQTASYILRQLGIWAHLGDNGASTLLALYQDEDGVSVPLEADDPGFNFTLYAIVTMSNQGSINVNYDSSAYVTRDALDEITDGMIKTVNFGGQVYTGDYAGSISIPVDAQPTENSLNTVKSGGTYDAIAGRVAKSGDTMTGNLTIQKSSYPSILFKTNASTTVGRIEYHTDDNTMDIQNYYPGSSYRESYKLPPATSGRTQHGAFYILTTKTIENDITINGGRIYFQREIDGVVKNIFRLQQAYGQVYFQTYDPELVNPSGAYTNFRLPKSLMDNKAYDIITSMGGTVNGILRYNTSNGTGAVWNALDIEGTERLSTVYTTSTTGTSMGFRQYTPDATHRENFNLPVTKNGISENVNYSILTMKPGAGYVYGANDTFSTLDALPCFGHMTGSSKNIYFSVTVDKSMASITSIEVTTLSGTIRTVAGNYLGDNGTSSVNWKTGNTVTAIKISDYIVRILISFPSAPTNAINNTPMALSVNVGLKFT